MLRMIPVLILCSSAMAMAEQPAAQPATPPAPQVAPVPAAEQGQAVAATEATEAVEAVEEPQMKKVCRAQEVVGSAIPRTVCVMKPVHKPNS